MCTLKLAIHQCVYAQVPLFFGSKFDMMNPAGFPHFNGQFCSFVAYLCGCGQECGHLAWT